MNDLIEETGIPVSTVRGRTFDGSPLTPGVNVDPVDVAAGVRAAATIGYDDGNAQMVAEHALLRHRRGEEESAQRLWLSEYPRDLTSWYVILAHACAQGVETATG